MPQCSDGSKSLWSVHKEMATNRHWSECVAKREPCLILSIAVNILLQSTVS